MELHKLKSAILVSADLSKGNLFDLKKLLGVDETDSFYHVVPVRLGYCFPDRELSGAKVHNVHLSVNEPLPQEQYTQHKFHIAEYGEFAAFGVDHARGLVNVSSYVTELECYITVYGK